MTARSLELTRPFGRAVVLGATGGTLPHIPARALNAMRSVTGFGFVQYRAARPVEARRQLGYVTGLLATGQLQVEVGAVVALNNPPGDICSAISRAERPSGVDDQNPAVGSGDVQWCRSRVQVRLLDVVVNPVVR